MSADRLTMMANQIGRFFGHRGAQAPAAIAAHIHDFWDPRMRTAMLAHLAAGGAGLDPLPRAALELLRDASSKEAPASARPGPLQPAPG